MKKRRKHKACLNCGELLHQNFNYCPNCGQENTDNQVSIGLLFREFVSNFFSLDSRFGRTFKPFLFSPGKVTLAFNEGKRVQYANPIRWYLVISIFHFFFMAKMFEPTAEDRKNHGFFTNSDTLTIAEFDSLYHLPDSSHSEGWPLSGQHLSLIDHLNKNNSMDPDEVMDSLRLNKFPFFRRAMVKQIVKINQETNASLNSYLLGQIPLIVFFLLPVFAFILKTFFWRKGLYIKHLIHSIHIHSFLFFLLAWVWIFELIFASFKKYGLPGAILLTTVYILISFKKVYKVKIRWGVLRLSMIGLIYFMALTFALGVGILLSLLLF